MRWTPELLAQHAEGRLERRSKRPVAGVSIDSRSVAPGHLFVPLIAARDGHDFATTAVERGAAALLWQHTDRPPPDGDLTVVQVRDTFEALTQLARHRRAAFTGPVVSVSGSNGKTTTRAMIRAVLEAGPAPVLATAGNLNNHLGVPLTLLGEPHEPRSMVLELGMSAPGENAHLARVVRPGVHVITSIALEHLEFMKTLEAIAAAEAEPLAFLPAGGLAVVPSDEPALAPHLPRRASFEVWRCGFDPNADVRILELRQGVHTEARMAVRGASPVLVRLRLFGGHNARNAAAALAVGSFLGIPLDAMVSALETVEPVGDRSRIIGWGAHWIVADCYNANPGSVDAALESLAQFGSDRRGPRIVVFGDMLELGPDEEALHAAVGERAAELGLDCLLTLGPRAAAASRVAAARGMDAHACDDLEAAARSVQVRMQGQSGGVVLVKGSRGMKMEHLIERLLQSGDDPSVH